jgi:predicted DNA-binding transcriptional regulator AlpA
MLLDRYLSREETADALRISPRSLDRWHTIRRGPPRLKLGARIYYDRQELENWIARQVEVSAA